MCTFKFSSVYIKKVLKKGEISYVFYLTEYVQSIIILTYTQYKNMNEIFHVCFSTLKIFKLWCVFYTFSTS